MDTGTWVSSVTVDVLIATSRAPLKREQQGLRMQDKTTLKNHPLILSANYLENSKSYQNETWNALCIIAIFEQPPQTYIEIGI